MKHGTMLVAATAMLFACKGGPAQSDADKPAAAAETPPALGTPTLEITSTKRRVTSPETGLVVQLPTEWEIASDTPDDGVGFRATHKPTLASCSMTLAPLKGRKIQELLDSAKLKQEAGPMKTTVYDAKLGDVPAKAKQMTNAKEGTHYKGTLEFRFAKQGEVLVAAYCTYTPLPKGFKPTAEAGAAGTAADTKTEPDPNAGAKAVFEFFDAVKLPAK